MAKQSQTSAVTSKIQKIALSDIVADSKCQTRDSINEDFIDTLVELIKAKLPIKGDMPVVFHDGKDYYLADGFTRLEAHKRAGHKKMECEVREGGLSQAIEYAHSEANATHGQPLDDGAKKKKIEWHLQHEKWKFYTGQVIADRCGLTKRYANKVINSYVGTSSHMRDKPVFISGELLIQWNKVVASNGIPKIAIRNGKEYVVNLAKMDQSEEEENSSHRNSKHSENESQSEVENERGTSQGNEIAKTQIATEESGSEKEVLVSPTDREEIDEKPSEEADPKESETPVIELTQEKVDRISALIAKTSRERKNMGLERFDRLYCAGIQCNPGEITAVYEGKYKVVSLQSQQSQPSRNGTHSTTINKPIPVSSKSQSEPKEALYDRLGNILKKESIRRSFALNAIVDRFIINLQALEDQLLDYARRIPEGEMLLQSAFEKIDGGGIERERYECSEIRVVIEKLRLHTPYCICPTCTIYDRELPMCGCCGGRGWNTKQQFAGFQNSSRKNLESTDYNRVKGKKV